MLKVLIAEDNVLIADMLESFLISEGFDVCGVCANIREAVALANLYKPDIGVFDFRLADGECGTQIRPLVENPDSLGILYVSGDSLNTRLTHKDGDAYIQKPYGMKDLSQAILIIHEMKSNGHISPSRFPRSFHLLEGPDDNHRKSA